MRYSYEILIYIVANAAVKVSSLTKGLRKVPVINKLKMKKIKTKGKSRKHHFSRNFKGKVIDGVHELYTLTAGMMLGMRCAVSFSLNNILATFNPTACRWAKLKTTLEPT